MLDYLIEMIVTQDEVCSSFLTMSTCTSDVFQQAFHLIDKGPFRRMLRFARPSLAEKDIPRRNTLKKEVLARALMVVERMASKLKVSARLCVYELSF